MSTSTEISAQGCFTIQLFRRGLFWVLCVGLVLSACDSPPQQSAQGSQSQDQGHNTDAAAEALTEFSDWLSDQSSAFGELLNSAQVETITRSFPVPELPDSQTPFQTQPDQRFEQWTLSSLTRPADGKDWVWHEQQFLRVAIAAANATDAEEASNWRFRDVMMQRYQSYDFASGSQVSDSVAERRALSLADVTDDSVYVHDVVALISHTGCASTFTLKRHSDTRADDTEVWQSRDCPERFRLGDTVFSGTRTVTDNDVRWVTHAYGQLPSLAGVVLIEQLEIVLSADEELLVNRSRRRTGSGPVTVSATLVKNGERQELGEVRWQMNYADAALFPESLVVQVPSLSQAYSIKVPAAFENGFNNDSLGVRHGVLAEQDGMAHPGLLTLYPRNSDNL